MYKLVVNGIQIGNYKNIHKMMEIAFNMEVVKNGIAYAKWGGEKEFRIGTKDWA